MDNIVVSLHNQLSKNSHGSTNEENIFDGVITMHADRNYWIKANVILKIVCSSLLKMLTNYSAIDIVMLR